MNLNITTDCNNCSHKEVCCMRFSLQKTLKKINTYDWKYSEKFSEILGDCPVMDKMEVSIRCPYYIAEVATVRCGTIYCNESSDRQDKSE